MLPYRDLLPLPFLFKAYRHVDPALRGRYLDLTIIDYTNAHVLRGRKLFARKREGKNQMNIINH